MKFLDELNREYLHKKDRSGPVLRRQELKSRGRMKSVKS